MRPGRLSVVALTFAALTVLSLFTVLASAHPGDVALGINPGGSSAVHVLRAATPTSGPLVEVFVNGTGKITWDPTSLDVPSGASVIFVVGIVGQIPHNFTLDAISNDTNLSITMTPSQVDTYFQQHPPLVRIPALNVSGAPYKTAPVQMPAHGVFEYICQVPEHFQSGMFGHLYVGVAEQAAATGFSLNLMEDATLFITTLALIVVMAVFLTRKHKPAKPLAPEDDEEA
ncbi:MAG: plastocyanin/azurin family copper-binding protein [Candidatus Thermoplasmatota archaeon]|jgi:uncharacterized cupredoxin-like copper-binding protein|nr:plastocyanin/azurin family copper-binding protein [Candidatus Thermoplasmatota archaeon]